MLDQILKALASGDFTVIEIELDDPSVAQQAERLIDRSEKNDRLIRKIYSTMRKHGFNDAAKQIRDWWKSKTALDGDILDRIGAIDFDKDSAEVEAQLIPLNAELKKHLDSLEPIIQAIVERHIHAVCSVDLSDLLV